ncbi:hypothetical protein SAMN04488125_11814 [Methylorubrum salsuginis]|uniref:Uncharacterized protein n=1 Tax=Methylorubrum salsuginis TaxID=414703 RepID=A0A1I4IQ97_9HYPH|nr:hypothetical protein SAMN04488125_11814 [Methylorubrum salsuginis]
MSGLFAVLPEGLAETRREDDLPDLLWAPVNLFHRRLERIERDLDDNEQAQRRSQAEQDFSEVRSVELEWPTDHGLALIARRESSEEMREATCRHYTALVGAPWQPRTGSLVARPRLTNAVIDSRAFLEARRRTEAAVLMPDGTRGRADQWPDLRRSSLDLGQTRPRPYQVSRLAPASRRIAQGR